MVTVTQLISGLAVVATTVSGAVMKRDVIGHDKVVGFEQTVPDSQAGKLFLKHKPWLDNTHGCVPFPAVDKDGNTSGGLKKGGAPEGHCSKSIGQIYARGVEKDGMFAIMYAWYWPKDNPTPAVGHRHDWESVVVWVGSEDENAEYKGIAASGHGGFQTRGADDSGVHFDGDRPFIKYFTIIGEDHSLGFTDSQGGEQPLIAWDSLPQVARDALENTDFGSANVPFIEKNFDNNLNKAKP